MNTCLSALSSFGSDQHEPTDGTAGQQSAGTEYIGGTEKTPKLI